MLSIPGEDKDSYMKKFQTTNNSKVPTKKKNIQKTKHRVHPDKDQNTLKIRYTKVISTLETFRFVHEPSSKIVQNSLLLKMSYTPNTHRHYRVIRFLSFWEYDFSKEIFQQNDFQRKFLLYTFELCTVRLVSEAKEEERQPTYNL